MAAGAWTPAAVLWTAGLWLGFLCHEPLLVLTGQRGQAARRRGATTARLQLAWLVPLAVGCGSLALWLAPTSATWAALPAMGAAAVHGLRLRRGSPLRSVGTEVAAAVALPLACLPGLLAAHLPFAVASRHVAIWGVGFALLTLAVHASKARTAGIDSEQRGRGLLIGAVLAGMGGLVVPGWGALALLAGTAAVTSQIKLAPRQIRLLGMAFAAVGAAAAVLLAVG